MNPTKFAFIAIIAFATACEDEDDAIAKDSQEVAGKNWVLSSEETIHVPENGRLESIITDECRKDDVYYFGVDGNYNVTLGSEQCVNESSQILTGTWDWWVSNQSILFRLRVISASSTTLKARIDFSGRLPILMTFTAVN